MKKFLMFCCLVLAFTSVSTEVHAKKANIGKSISKGVKSAVKSVGKLVGGKKSPIGQIVKTIIKFPTESAKMLKSMVKLVKNIASTRKDATKKVTPAALVALNEKMGKIVEEATKLSESLHNHPIVKEVDQVVKLCGSPVVTVVAATPAGGGLGVVCGRMNAVQAILGRYMDKADGLALAAVDGKENISNKMLAAGTNDPSDAAAANSETTPEQP
jgi:hypothetical protein